MKSKFAAIFDDTARFLRSKGVEPTVSISKPATVDEVQEFQGTTGLVLPHGFLVFFTEFSNGYGFHWQHGDESGGVSMPSLRDLAATQLEWIGSVSEFSDDPHSMDNCIEPQFRERAFAIWSGMKTWLPFFKEYDGDSFCVRLADGVIVFDKHDWFDGFGDIAETNGLIAGADLLEFLNRWSLYSFQPQWFTDRPHLAAQVSLDWLDLDPTLEFDRHHG